MQNGYILALDQGTTSSRAAVYTTEGRQVSLAFHPLQAFFPAPGLVEQDPEDIWSSQISAAAEAVQRARIRPEEVLAVGIANQRETTVAWDKTTGNAIAPAIVWQDRRTQNLCRNLINCGWENKIHRLTGLWADPYFSATKMQWLLEHPDLQSVL